MENFKDYIGTKVGFDSKSETYTLLAFSKHLYPAIEALRIAWEALELGDFTQSSFDRLMGTDGVTWAQDQYEAMLNEDVAKLNIKSLVLKNQMMSSAPDMIRDLREKRDGVKSAFEQARIYGEGVTIHLDWGSFAIIEGEAVLDKDKLRETCTTYIRTPTQAQSYAMVKAIAEAQNEYLKFLKSTGVGINNSTRSLIDPNQHIITIEGDGQATVRPEAAFYVDGLLKFKQQQEDWSRSFQVKAEQAREQRQKQWDSATHDINGKPYVKP